MKERATKLTLMGLIFLRAVLHIPVAFFGVVLFLRALYFVGDTALYLKENLLPFLFLTKNHIYESRQQIGTGSTTFVIGAFIFSGVVTAYERYFNGRFRDTILGKLFEYLVVLFFGIIAYGLILAYYMYVLYKVAETFQILGRNISAVILISAFVLNTFDTLYWKYYQRIDEVWQETALLLLYTSTKLTGNNMKWITSSFPFGFV